MPRGKKAAQANRNRKQNALYSVWQVTLTLATWRQRAGQGAPETFKGGVKLGLLYEETAEWAKYFS